MHLCELPDRDLQVWARHRVMSALHDSSLRFLAASFGLRLRQQFAVRDVSWDVWHGARPAADFWVRLRPLRGRDLQAVGRNRGMHPALDNRLRSLAESLREQQRC